MLRELQSHMFCLLTIIQSHIIPVFSGDVTLGLHSYQWLQNYVSMVTIDVTMVRTELVLWDTSHPITTVTHEKKNKFELDCEWRHTHFKLTTRRMNRRVCILSLFLSHTHTRARIHAYIHTYIYANIIFVRNNVQMHGFMMFISWRQMLSVWLEMDSGPFLHILQLKFQDHPQIWWDTYKINIQHVCRVSTVGIDTAYGMDHPEIESHWGRDFPY